MSEEKEVKCDYCDDTGVVMSPVDPTRLVDCPHCNVLVQKSETIEQPL